MKPAPGRSRPLLAAALLALPLALPSALDAQDRIAVPELREGATFHRVVTTSLRSETPRGVHEEVTHYEARLQVTELRADGSGVFEIEPTVMRAEWTQADGESGSWDSDTDPEPTEGRFRVPPDFVGHTFQVPFLPGGELDLAFFQSAPESDEELLALMGVSSLLGPQDRADGLPSGLSGEVEVGTPARSMSIPGSTVPMAEYRLVGIEERAGRLEGLVEISGGLTGSMFGFDEGVGRLTGQVRIDVERGQVIESVLSLSHQVAQDPDSRHHMEFQYRTVPAS